MSGWVLVLLYVVFIVVCGGDILHNPGFEGSLSPIWACTFCNMTSSNDHVEGSHSVKVTHREKKFSGVYQAVNLQGWGRYYVEAHVKQLNTLQDKMYQRYTILMMTQKHDGSLIFNEMVNNRAIRVTDGWRVLSGYYLNRNTDIQRVTVRVSGPDPGIEYLVDNFTLTFVPEVRAWKTQADKQIDRYRKNNIHFKVHVQPHVTTSDLQIQVDLVKHAFPFGSQTMYELLDNYPHYNDLFYYMFNWATVNDFYWYRNPQPPHNPTYNRTMAAIDQLRRHGVPVRGHNVFWGTKPKNTPSWVQALNAEQIKQAVEERINYIVKDAKGRVAHWDVNNELLHGKWFEKHTGDPDFSQKMFANLHKLDPNAKLFLNDYHVVAQGTATTAFVDQAREFQAANVGLYGLGAQCHFSDYYPPDPTTIWKRLDQLSSTGLPIWVTEMDISHRDENTRAEWYDMALRILFSHPAVEGIILWGFWDVHQHKDSASLVNGPKYHVNAAGLRYINLIHQEWSTHVTHDVSSGKQFDVRGFHGDYRVIVKYHGNPILQKTFSLGKEDKHVDIQITNVNDHITVPTTKSPIIYNEVLHHPIAHINELTIGQMTSGASNQLNCITRYSGLSEVADDKFAEVSCPSGFVLTGCVGKIMNNHNTRDGEKVVMQQGSAVCRTYDAGGSTAPVQAIARCCKLSGLSCDYLKSGPSEGVLNQRLETRCHHHQYATGCSTHAYFGLLDGTFPGNNSCFAQNTLNRGGVESYAVCCSAPSLTCQVKISPPAGDKQGDHTSVSCDQGWVLVGCSAYSDDAKLGGAYIHGSPEECVVINGAERLYGEMGATAYITCCRLH